VMLYGGSELFGSGLGTRAKDKYCCDENAEVDYCRER
jgi:hypothetical protein